MDTIALWVYDLSYNLPQWGSFLLYFLAPYLSIGLLVRSAIAAALLGALSGVACLSLLFVDFVPFEELSLEMIGLSTAYGAVLASATSILSRTARRRLLSAARTETSLKR